MITIDPIKKPVPNIFGNSSVNMTEIFNKVDKKVTEKLEEFKDNIPSGNGVPIVDSEDKLETLDLPQGSLASVAHDGIITTSFRNLWQPTADILDETTGTLVNPERLSRVTELQWSIQNKGALPERIVLYFIPSTFSVENYAMIQLVIADKAIGAVIRTMDGYKSYSIANCGDNGMWVTDGGAIDAFNDVLLTDDWCYLSNVETGFVITDAQFDCIDKIVKAVSTGTDVSVRIKDKRWERVALRDEIPTIVTNTNKINGYVTVSDIFRRFQELKVDKWRQQIELRPGTLIKLSRVGGNIVEFASLYNVKKDGTIDFYGLLASYDVIGGYLKTMFLNTIYWDTDLYDITPNNGSQLLIIIKNIGNGELFGSIKQIKVPEIELHCTTEEDNSEFTFIKTNSPYSPTNMVANLVVDGITKEEITDTVNLEASGEHSIIIKGTPYKGMFTGCQFDSIILKEIDTVLGEYFSDFKTDYLDLTEAKTLTGIVGSGVVNKLYVDCDTKSTHSSFFRGCTINYVRVIGISYRYDLSYIYENTSPYICSYEDFTIRKSLDVNSAGVRCFYGLPNDLKVYCLNNSVIGQEAFANSNVYEVFIAEGTSLVKQCFANSKVKKIIFKGNVEWRGYSDQFSGCSLLELIDCTNCTSIFPIPSNVFGSNENLQIVVPDELYDEWIVAEKWSNYASQIVKVSGYVEPTE